jgi:CHAT domain-containing protein
LLAFGFTGGSGVRDVDASKADIAGTETELVALSGKFPDGTFLFGDGVTEKKFKEGAGNYDLLHLAVHGSGDTGEDYSATLYFRDSEGEEDGRLYWYELYGMNLKASLAVLSSCESGIGKTYRGEGMLSMANAFTFAGCSNVVMGLWKVDDQVSVKLMDKFYSELLEGMAIDEALALAKRTYLASADQVSANPKIWGSLVAYGEAQVIKPDEIHAGWVVVAIAVLAAAVFLLVRKTRK